MARISYFMNQEQRRQIVKAFISSQFGNCPLVWLFCSRRLNNRINRIWEQALRIVYNDKSRPLRSYWIGIFLFQSIYEIYKF